MPLTSETFVAVFDQHHAEIHRFLQRRLGVEGADDLASEVFLRAFRARSDFDDTRGSVRAWLFGIALNISRERARATERRQRAYRSAALDPTVPVAQPPHVADARSEPSADAVRAAVDRLPEAYREPLLLFTWEGLAYEEIATALGVPLGTVRSRLSRARQRLREDLVASSSPASSASTTPAPPPPVRSEPSRRP